MRQRKAFTLVEMLVAVALIIFIMVLLSEAFVAGLETFRQLKAIGDMEERMRMVTTVLRRDLTADHFEGKRRLSDFDFWQQGPPREGYFRIWQSTPLVLEGSDPDHIYSTRSVNTSLSYTIKKRGNRREDFFTARRFNPGTTPGFPTGVLTVLDQLTTFNQPDFPSSRFEDTETYTSQWAEAVVFLRPNGTTAGGQPLFSLYRQVKLLLPNNSAANFGVPGSAPGSIPPITVGSYNDVQRLLTNNRFPANGPNIYPAPYAEFSCQKIGTAGYSGTGAYNPPNNTLYFNNPTDVTVPQRRYGMDQPSFGGIPIRLAIGAATPFPVGPPDASYPKFGDDVSLILPPAAAATTPLLGQDPTLAGADLLLTDLLSFDVQVLIPESRDRLAIPSLANPLQPLEPYVDLFDSVAQRQYPSGHPSGQIPLPALVPQNPMFQPGSPLVSNPNLPRDAAGNPIIPKVFDTWTTVVDGSTAGVNDFSFWNDQRDPGGVSGGIPLNQLAQRVPLRLRILALKITLRVWDARTQQVRQITIIQDM
jgi:Prokaryotic N-terminal methylation motif